MRARIQKFISWSAVTLLVPALFLSCSDKRWPFNLAERFDGKYGQIEVGGPYVGVEFHHSRPLPSRFSFYYPVANSLDLSTDYWQRDLSLPLQIELTRSGRTEIFGLDPAVYHYTPYSVAFYDTLFDCRIELRCEFADLPFAALTLMLDPLTQITDSLTAALTLNPTLRTSHTYAWKSPAKVLLSADGRFSCAFYDEAETDSAVVFLLNVDGEKNHSFWADLCESPDSFPMLKTKISAMIAPRSPSRAVWLIGSCRKNELRKVVEKAGAEWENGVRRLGEKIRSESLSADFETPDPVMNQAMLWSKATVAALHHYIDGRFVPMPCPAEYNFFFTHDLLLTGLGVVAYHDEFLRNGYEFLLSKTEPDSVLPHAYYWKDGRFVTEKCTPDNWNNLWIIISAGNYLKHSGDAAMIVRLYPVLQKSLRAVLQNLGQDHLMYAYRPDWWDIGNVYGARTYLTVLTIRAMEEFAFLSSALGRDCPADSLLSQAANIKAALMQKLWSEKLGFLINGLDRVTLDEHYYAGSLIACMFDAVDGATKRRMLQTAREQLLDEALGIRNAWPPDFHQLVELYRFNGLEVGRPYYYFNAGIWMHNNAWYALSLIQSGQINQAEHFIKKTMTPNGVQNSPRGQPSFYEYRMSDPAAPDYGAVDKPNFLWAAGWTIQALYRLAGLRETPSHLSFASHLPDDWCRIEYDVLLYGKLCHVRYTGSGRFFRSIRIDGRHSHSAVVNGPAKRITLERGFPQAPYLAEAVGRIRTVSLAKNRRLEVALSHVPGQQIRLKVVSPWPLKKVQVDGEQVSACSSERSEEGVFVLTLDNTCRKQEERYAFQF